MEAARSETRIGIVTPAGTNCQAELRNLKRPTDNQQQPPRVLKCGLVNFVFNHYSVYVLQFPAEKQQILNIRKDDLTSFCDFETGSVARLERGTCIRR